MKLSVKLLSGLALMVLVAVAVVGLSNSASAAVDGKIYVTNVASNLTNEAGQNIDDDGRLTVTTVYGTYVDLSTRDIVDDSDFFIVTVIDSDLNSTTNITSDTGAPGTVNAGYEMVAPAGTDVTIVLEVGGVGTFPLNFPGEKVLITLTDEIGSPIVGDDPDIKVLEHNSNVEVVGVSVDSFFRGTDGEPAWVVLVVDFGTGPAGTFIDIGYPTSLVETINATVKSAADTSGDAVVLLTETGRDTGRFEGLVQVLEFVSGGFEIGLPGDGLTPGTAAKIPSSEGLITVTYVDAENSGPSSQVRTTTITIDTTVPTVTFATPAHDTESQNRFPTFTGNVSDAQSGLDISSFALVIDETDDASNGDFVIDPGTGNPLGVAAGINTAALGSDGAAAVSFSWAQLEKLPIMVPVDKVPNNLVDFQATMSDLAGNIGYSDSDPSDDATATGRHGNQPHVIKIDQKIPAFTSGDAAFTGLAYDPDNPETNLENVRDSIKLIFDGKLKATSVSTSDFQVTFSGAGGVFVPASVLVIDEFVFLDLDTTIPSDNTPEIKIQGTIQDLAGNSTDSGSTTAVDKLVPVLTVTRSGGSGTGTGSEAADSLTSDQMTITISSDENLVTPPTITATNLNGPSNIFSGLAVAQGGDVWTAIVTKSATTTGGIAIKVVGTDTATNAATVGDVTTKVYSLDTGLSDPVMSPLTSTTQPNPFLTADYGASNETSSVTITSATLDGVDVTSSLVGSADSKTFFFQPATALSDGEHVYIVKAIDAAGNTNTKTNTFTKSDRTDFVLGLFAGWNVVSVPSNPLVTDIGSVMSNTGIKQVVAYDATTPSQPWRIASKVGSGAYSSQTTPGLTTITAGPGYWIETSDFEDQNIALEGEAGPGDARPGLITIATGNGWNLIGVVDQSRKQTQANSGGIDLTRPNADGSSDDPVSVTSYFTTVNHGRAYVFNTVQSQFNEIEGEDKVVIGSGIWVFISAQQNGKFPPIVP